MTIKKEVYLIVLCLLLIGCADKSGQSVLTAPVHSNESLALATFAGGCFWCMEGPFEKLDGVLDVVSGYTGGAEKNPSYKEVASGGTRHAEAVQITYEPAIISYDKLLEVFWMQVDPTDANGQFVDRGKQYRTGIFYHTQEQKQLAEESKRELDQSGRYDDPIVTEITPASAFYRAEEYHQDYHTKNPIRYKFYRGNSGRDQYLDRVWGEERVYE